MYRSSEWLLIIFFTYVAVIAYIVRIAGHVATGPAQVFFACWLTLTLLSRFERRWGLAFSVARDWVPLAFTLVAYRAMDWFTPRFHDHHLESAWIGWDRVLLRDWGLQRLIECAGPVIPTYLEFCYLVVYAVSPVAVGLMYARKARSRVNTVVFSYLIGTLTAYALFPYFPSEPPRVVFPFEHTPHVNTIFRGINLWLVGGYGIHSSVFPSAHVSSAFSAAFGIWIAMPKERRLWIGMLIYAVSVALATVYGRYHYAVDAMAGIAVSVCTAPVTLWIARRYDGMTTTN